MAAPDLPAPITHAQLPRPTSVHLTPTRLDVDELRGAVVVMIDALRASATIAAALHAGATRIAPVLTVEQATAAAATQTPRPLLCGERAGRHIPGFDLGNSPRTYTRAVVGGRPIVFTTTNGTAALLHAAGAGAAEILVGCFSNLSVVCDRLAADPRPVVLLCAGTRDRVTLDDCITAGAMVDRLIASGRSISTGDGGDPARLCLAAWHLAEEDLPAAMLASRGGRNLASIDLQQDVYDCSRIDSAPVIPRFDPAAGVITPV